MSYSDERPRGIRRFAQELTIIGGILIVIALVAIFASFFPGGRSVVWQVTQWGAKAGHIVFAFAAVIFLIVVGPLAGFLFRVFVVIPMDEKIEPEQEVGFVSHWIIAIGFGALGGVLTMMTFYGIWPHDGVKVLLNLFGQLHPEEVAPFGWAIWGWLSFMAGYGIVSLSD